MKTYLEAFVLSNTLLDSTLLNYSLLDFIGHGVFLVSIYRYYTGVGLISLVLLPVVMMALGLLCGIFGHDKRSSPSERGSISNIGGNCLMA